MRKLIFALAVLAAFGSTARAQQAPQAPPTLEQVMQRQWAGITGKIIAMAKDLPEDKWDYRIHKDTRSGIEELWHCMASMQSAALFIKGTPARGEEATKLFSNEGKPRNRAEIVAAMEKAAKELNDAVSVKADIRQVGGIEHLGEHYGKLVQIYRAQGLVPPASRGN